MLIAYQEPLQIISSLVHWAKYPNAATHDASTTCECEARVEEIKGGARANESQRNAWESGEALGVSKDKVLQKVAELIVINDQVSHSNWLQFVASVD